MRMSVQRWCLAAGFFVLMCGAYRATAQSSETKPMSPATPAKKSPWKPEDFVYTESASQFRVSPNGKWAVWVKSTADKDKDTRVSNLILSSLTEKMEIPLTRDTDAVSQPRWSLSGETVAFLSTHALPKPKPENSPTQLWLINAAGGDAWPVTEFAKEIKSFEWIDNDTISIQRGRGCIVVRTRNERAQGRHGGGGRHAARAGRSPLQIRDQGQESFARHRQ